MRRNVKSRQKLAEDYAALVKEDPSCSSRKAEKYPEAPLSLA
jgi:hypothetical protein